MATALRLSFGPSAFAVATQRIFEGFNFQRDDNSEFAFEKLLALEPKKH